MQSTSPRTFASLIVGLFAWILTCFVAAAIGGFATAASVNDWYAQLNLPDWNPPGWVFGPVWTALYLMMGIAAWIVWKDTSGSSQKLPLGWFLFHLLLNSLWSILFFGLRQPGWAFAEILLLWAAIVVSIVLFYRHSRVAAALLIPYLLWVTFASFLNFRIWQLNGP